MPNQAPNQPVDKTELWSQEELLTLWPRPGSLSGQDAHLSGSSSLGATGVQIDSRLVQTGDLFVPLTAPWAQRDGHDFIAGALEAGASVHFCAQPSQMTNRGIAVTDTFDALNELATASVNRAKTAQRVALTGSSGKTTLRAWLEHALGDQCHLHASAGSFNNHLGVPLSLARMPRDTELGVFEIGTNHPGEIGPLSNLVNPDLAIVLNVLPVHIGHFEHFDALVQEKLSIASGVEAGTLLCPTAFKHAVRAKPGVRVLTFGPSADADFTLAFEQDGIHFAVTSDDGSFEGSAPASGATYQETAAVTLIAAHLLGFSTEAAARNLATAEMPAGRGVVIKERDITLIDDSYNANPTSMKAAIDRLKAIQDGRKIAILGEMYELGDEGPRAHADIASVVNTLDQVVMVGEGFRPFAASAMASFATNASDIDLLALAASLREGDTLLVKGSNGVFWTHQFVQQLADAIKTRR